MLDIGRNIIEGLWDGIIGAKDWLWNKITGFAGGIVSGFKDALGIRSPSRIMRDIVGTNIVKGIGVGVDVETPNLEKNINSNISDLTARLKTTVDYETAKTTANVVAQNNYEIIRNSPEASKPEKGTNNKTIIEVPVIVEGREIARATAPYQEEFEKWSEGR